MESRAKFLGHPIHPMLIVFPLGLFITAAVFDIVYLVTRNEVFAAVSFYNITGGIIGGVLAALFGFRDYIAIPSGTRAKHIGLWHGLGNLVVLLLFSFSWLTRWTALGYVPPVLALLTSFGAVGIGAITGWLGGELVDRLGVGVDPGANLNAPSSLSEEPAEISTRMVQVPVTGEERESDIVDEP